MRCKNCGTDNDDNRYICETCGSPLYDEEDIDSFSSQDNEAEPSDYNMKSEEEPLPPVSNQKQPQENENKEQMKKSIITIAVLVVILIAIIASVAVIASTKSRNKEEETSSTSTTVDETTTADSFTSERTTKQRTTEKTTAEKTTKETTTAASWIINVSSSGGGTVSGAGEYENGKKVTITAAADDGYEFDGWYSNGVKVSSSAKYTFKANENASFSAVFNPVETTAATTEPTSVESTDDDTEVMFGDYD